MVIKGLQLATAARMQVVSAAASVRSAALAFADREVGLLVICDENGRAAGVVSKSDLVRHLAAGGIGQAPLSPVMSRSIVSCSPGDDLYSTWKMMKAHGLQNLPVVGPGELPLGVLDIRDALAALLDEEQHEERLLENYIAGVGYR